MVSGIFFTLGVNSSKKRAEAFFLSFLLMATSTKKITDFKGLKCSAVSEWKRQATQRFIDKYYMSFETFITLNTGN